MSELNCVELKLKEIYDAWDLGNELEKNPEYSSMFRMGFPDDFINRKKPLVMYVGQECLRCNEEKTQEWVRKYQTVQMKKECIDGFGEINTSPFWNFYRKIADKGYNVLWNNLDKFHPYDSARVKEEDAKRINARYGEDNKSVFQREIELINPDIVLLTIGPKKKYVRSLCAAFGIDECIDLIDFNKPTLANPIVDITHLLPFLCTKILWTYHPAYLNRIKKYSDVLEMI